MYRCDELYPRFPSFSNVKIGPSICLKVIYSSYLCFSMAIPAIRLYYYTLFSDTLTCESHISQISLDYHMIFPKFSGYLMSMNPISKHIHKVPKHGMRI